MPLTVQLVSVIVPPVGVARPPPSWPAELPLTVQLVSVVVPPLLYRPPPLLPEIAADGAVGQRDRAVMLHRPPPVVGGGVAADGAVGQRGRAAIVVQAAAVRVAGIAAGDRQSRDRRRDTRVDLEHPARPAAADRHARRRARDRLRPARVAQLELGAGQRDRLRRGEDGASKSIVLAPVVEFAWAIAWRRSVSPATGVSVGLFTTNVDSSLRSSSAINVGRIRRHCRCRHLDRRPPALR